MKTNRIRYILLLASGLLFKLPVTLLAVETNPSITALHCLTPMPKVGLPCEVAIDLAATYADPFDPDEIALDATVETPSRTYSAPGFFYEPFARDTDGVRPAGPASWRFRFLPTEPGPHRISVCVKDKTGSAKLAPLVVQVAARDWPGLLRVSKQNPLSFAFDNGTTMPLMGFNVFGDMNRQGKPLAAERIDRDRMRMEQLAAAGGNFIRLRADSWWYALDNPPDRAAGFAGPAKINLRSAWDVDALVTLCEQKNIQIMFCLENANATVNEPSGRWQEKFNTFQKSHGGTVKAMADFWSDAASKKIFQRKLRYVIARWGASPAVAMWEFFNEEKIKSAPAVAWHAEMAAYLKAFDPHRRMVTTSGAEGGQSKYNDDLWHLQAMDVVQYHAYKYENTADLFSFCCDQIKRHGKPFITGEFGAKSGQRENFDYNKDTAARMPHLGHWGSAMAGSPVAALDWYVSKYETNQQFYADFTHLKAFLADVPYGDPGMKAIVPQTSAADIQLHIPANVRLAPTPEFKKAPFVEYTLREDGTLEPSLATFNGYIWGQKAHADLRNPPIFIVNYPVPGRFVMRVIEVVGAGPNPVRITLDGATALEADLVCELGQGKESQKRTGKNVAVVYDRDLAINVPAGQHRIGVDNLGSDRFSAAFAFEKYATLARGEVLAAALVHKRGVHLWIANRSWCPEALIGLVQHKPANDVRATSSGLRNGDALVEWMDPLSGQTLRHETIVIKDGKAVLNAGDVPRDIACRLKYREENGK